MNLMRMVIQKMMGERLKQLRKERGWTQRQLAEKLETDPHYISAIENGKRGAGKDLLERYGEIFELSQEEIEKMLPNGKEGEEYPPIIQMIIERLMVLPESEQAKYLAHLCQLLEQKDKE